MSGFPILVVVPAESSRVECRTGGIVTCGGLRRREIFGDLEPELIHLRL